MGKFEGVCSEGGSESVHCSGVDYLMCRSCRLS